MNHYDLSVVLYTIDLTQCGPIIAIQSIRVVTTKVQVATTSSSFMSTSIVIGKALIRCQNGIGHHY